MIFIGGGGHCKSVIEAAESVGMKVDGILDMPGLKGTDVLGVKVIGSDDEIERLSADGEIFVVTVGSLDNVLPRKRLHEKVDAAGARLATVIAASASVSRYASVAEGTVVLHNACVNAGARVGRGCILNTLCNIEHDVVIGDYTHVSTGAMINGDCRVGSCCLIGSGAVIHNGVSICDNVAIGAGSVVNHDITEPGIYLGMPARKLRSRD